MDEIRELIQAGQIQPARRRLKLLIQANPHDLEAWAVYVKTLPSASQRLRALQDCQQYNPDSLEVRQAIENQRAALKPRVRLADRRPKGLLDRFSTAQWAAIILLGLLASAALGGLGVTAILAAAITPEPLPAVFVPPTFAPTTTLTPILIPSQTLPPPATSVPLRPSSTPLPSRTRQIPLRELLQGGQEPIVIGYSVEGRPLEVYRFGVGPRERLIIAGIHGGDEWNTIALADELIIYINHHPEVIPQDMSLFILRSLNPDGEARSRDADGRVNANGVDLNRNWDANWQKTWNRQGCWRERLTTSGNYPASEPETQSLMNFVINRRFEALISYHSAALGIFPAGTPPDPASARLAETIAGVSTYPYPPIDTGCIYTGTLVDWALKEGIAGVDVELTDPINTDFEMNLEVLRVFLAWRP